MASKFGDNLWIYATLTNVCESVIVGISSNFDNIPMIYINTILKLSNSHKVHIWHETTSPYSFVIFFGLHTLCCWMKFNQFLTTYTIYTWLAIIYIIKLFLKIIQCVCVQWLILEWPVNGSSFCPIMQPMKLSPGLLDLT